MMKILRLSQDPPPEPRPQPVDGCADASGGPAAAETHEVVRAIFNNLSQLLGRPLRVLDLGGDLNIPGLQQVTEGYVIETLGCEGASDATTTSSGSRGIVLDESQCHRILDRLRELKPGEFDCIVAFRTLHHVASLHGFAFIRDVVNRFRALVAVLIVEDDLDNEACGGCGSQGAAEQLICDYSFRHPWSACQIGCGSSSRAFYVASDRYWVLPGATDAFEHWTTVSNASAPNTHLGTRRHYFNAHRVMKYADIAHPVRGYLNHDEWIHEIAALNSLRQEYPDIHIRASGCWRGTAWLVRDKIQGVPLTPAAQQTLGPQDRVRIVKDIALILAKLERRGWIHTDIRSWNIVLQGDGTAALIDFGALRRLKGQERNALRADHLEFLTWVREMLCGADAGAAPRAALVCPAVLPTPMDNCAWELLAPEGSPQRGRYELFVDGGSRAPSEATDLRRSRRAVSAVLAFCDEKNQALLKRVQELEAECREIEQARNERTVQLEEAVRLAQGSAADWERKVTAIVDVLAHQIQEQRALQRRIRQAEAQADTEKAACNEMKDKYFALKTTAEQATRAHEETAAHVETLRATHEFLQRAYRSECDTHGVTKDQCAAYERDIMRLRAQLSVVSEERKDLANRVAQNKKRLLRVAARYDEAVKTQREFEARQLKWGQIEASIAQLREIVLRTCAPTTRPGLATDTETLAFAVQQVSALCHSSHWWHEHANQLNAEVNALRASTSWRITWPLRACNRATRLALRNVIAIAQIPIQRFRQCVRLMLLRAMSWCLRRPALARALAQRLECLPPVKRHLRLFAVNQGLIRNEQQATPACQDSNGVFREGSWCDRLEAKRGMGPRARAIYDELQLMLTKQEGGQHEARH